MNETGKAVRACENIRKLIALPIGSRIGPDDKVEVQLITTFISNNHIII